MEAERQIQEHVQHPGARYSGLAQENAEGLRDRADARGSQQVPWTVLGYCLTLEVRSWAKSRMAPRVLVWVAGVTKKGYIM